MAKPSTALMSDIRWVLSFGAGTEWSLRSGFRPNRLAELISFGVLLPLEKPIGEVGFTVGNVSADEIETRFRMAGLI